MEQKKEYIKRLLDMVEDGIVSKKDILKYFPEAAYNAEWSEEDEKYLDGVIDSLRRYNYNVPSKAVDEQILWLKSLRPQKPYKKCAEEIENADKNETTPDFIMPDFLEGDLVVNRLGDVWHIDSFDGKNYQVSNGDKNNYFPIEKQKEMRLWDIKKDASIGDCIVDKDGNIGFFENMCGNYYWHSLIYINDDGELFYDEAVGGGMHKCFMSQPATEVERKKLTDAMFKNSNVLSVVLKSLQDRQISAE